LLVLFVFIGAIRGSRTSGQDGARRGLAIDEVAAWVSFTLGTSFFPSHVKNRLHTHIDLDEMPTMWSHCNMTTSLIAIGNSRGIRIPKPLIEQCGLQDEVEMEVRDDAIVLRSPRSPRAGWDKAFAQMARLGDDALLHSEPQPSKWDEEEWEWK
jgi:antitoxin MazE